MGGSIATIDATAEWFERERGITRDTLKAFRIAADDNTVFFPYPNAVKQRSNPATSERRRFFVPKGWQPELFRCDQQPASGTAFLVEGETDTMRLWQALAGGAAVFGVSGVNNWRPELAADLAGYDRVFVILDNDTDYTVRSQVDNAWRSIRSELRGKARRITLPDTVKDLCEFFSLFDLTYLVLLSKRTAASRFEPVDFTVSPPPVNWLMDGWIALGDVTLLAGLGGLGKSIMAQGLAVAVANGANEYMGIPIHSAGRVLYVDEENPLDVVHSRLRRLGLDLANPGNVRYLWNQGVRLDRAPDQLIEEATNYEPKLIVLDSLTRFHTAEENDSGAMAALFNDAIRPLARDVGAAVIVLHHHGKGGVSARGSGDILNVSDAVIDLFGQGVDNPGQFVMHMTKSRRRLGGVDWPVSITDNPDGTTSLVPHPISNPRF